MPRADWPAVPDSVFRDEVVAARPSAKLLSGLDPAGRDLHAVCASDEQTDWRLEVLGSASTPLEAWVAAWEVCG